MTRPTLALVLLALCMATPLGAQQAEATTDSMKQLRGYPLLGPGASGGAVFEIYPDEDGEYEIRALSLQGSRISTRLRLYRDAGESSAPDDGSQVFLARHLRASRTGSSWSLQLSYSRGFFGGFKRPDFSTGGPFTPKNHRVTFGIGWYR